MDTAQHIVIQVAHGDFAAVEQRLAGYIKPLLSVEALRASWQGIEQQVGAFQELGKTSIVQTQQGLVHVVTCIFERASLDVNVVLNDAGEIIGLTITPVGTIEQQANATYEPPSYAQPERFQEHEIQIGHGTWVLPGTMSIPRGDGPFAAVLLVHGSGPQDRDETIPPNKPFRDLAWGLASQGIAVLRYEKRTKAYAAQLGSVRDTITVKEEVLDDALEAVALLRERPEIDAQQIFVLGHSLGGYLAPRIGEADPQIRGLIILAGSARPFEEVILDQMTYVLSLTMPDPVVQQQQLAVVKQQVELVKDPLRLPTAAATDLPLNVPAAYWLDLNAYQPEQVAQTLKQPMLFLQGEGDYQVTREDYQIWQNALGGRDDVQFIMYPGLSHLFMPIEGGQKATPATYSVAGHVAEEVVNEIGSWIKRISRQGTGG
ncbi:MAG TPA: alpha/beta fold hydrolase [Ktedonobacteraceae bacterium]|nr:alpha/beta fold hydrolase [Ktedonobacteraceae bacterium]